MADSTLATLVVKLQAEISEYTAGLKQATQQIQSFASDVGDSIGNVAKNLAGLYALKQVFDFTESIVSSAAKFDILSHAVGISADTLSQFAYAAKLEGVDDISAPLEKLARSAGSVAEGNQKAAAAYAALGVSVTDTNGKLKTTDQLFLDVADAASKYGDGIGKTRAIQEILGRSGADFIAFLDQGADKIAKAQQEAVDLGVAISTATAQGAHEFEENLTRIGAAMHGIFNQALVELLPALQELSDRFVDFAKDKEAVQSAVDGVVAAFRGLVTAGYAVAAVLEIIGKTVGEMVALLPLLARAWEDVSVNIYIDPSKTIADLKEIGSQAKTILSETNNDIGKFLHDSADQLKTLWHDATPSETDMAAFLARANKYSALLHQKPQVQLNDSTATKNVEKAIDGLVKLNDTLAQQVATFGQVGEAATVYDLTLGKLSGSVDALNNMSSKGALTALNQLQQQGKITVDLYDLVREAIQKGLPPGDALRDNAIALADQLQKLKDADAFTKLDDQILKMTGHLQEAAKSAFDLSNRPISISTQQRQFAADPSKLTELAVIDQVNDALTKGIEIRNSVAKAIADVAAADKAAGVSDEQSLGDQTAARVKLIAQLEEVQDRMQALANASKMPEAVEAVEAIKQAVAGLKINDDTLASFQKLNQLAAQNLELVNKSALAEKAAAEQLTSLNVLQSQGYITDIDLMNQRDAVLNAEIAKLKEYQSQINTGTDQGKKDFDEMGAKINALTAQTGELARTIRDDIVDAASNAFSAFVTGSESASKAFHQFLTDVNKTLVDLFSKSLFQKFAQDALGSGSPIADALSKIGFGTGGGGAGADTGVTLETAVATGGTTAGLEMQSSIISAGSIVADEWATTLATAGAAGGGGGGGLGGLSDIFSLSGVTDASFDTSALSEFGPGDLSALEGLAGGGPVTAGQPYLVGENGPELMVPDTGGQIIPSGSFGGGVNVTNHFYIDAPKGTVSRATQAQIAAQASLSLSIASARNN